MKPFVGKDFMQLPGKICECEVDAGKPEQTPETDHFRKV